MTKATAKIFLIIFGNLLIFILGGGIFLIWQATGWSFMLVGSILGIAHTVVSTVSCRRFRDKFEIMPKDYVLYSAAPAFVIGALLILVCLAAIPVIGDMTGVVLFIGAFPTVYSIIYLTVLSVAAAYC